MSKKQTRRCVSFTGELYDALRSYCIKEGKTMSSVVETELRKFLRMTRIRSDLPQKTEAPELPAEEEKPARKNDGSVVKIDRAPGNVFTF